MSDSFALNVDTSGIQVLTRNFPVQDIGDGESLATSVHRGTQFLLEPAYNQAFMAARRGVDFAIWNNSDSKKILNINKIDGYPSKGMGSAQAKTEANNALSLVKGTVSGGTPVTPICLDDASESLPSTVECVASPYLSSTSVLASTYQPVQRGRFDASPQFLTNFWTMGSGVASTILGFNTQRSLSLVQPAVANTNEGVALTWGANGLFLVQSYELVFIANGHTWLLRYEGVPNTLGAVIAIRNASASPVKVVSASFMESAPNIRSANTAVTPTYFLRGINKYIPGSGKEISPTSISGGTWPSGIKCYVGPTVVHEAIPDRTDGKSDHSLPYIPIQPGPIGVVTTTVTGFGLPGPMPYEQIYPYSPIVIRPGEGIAIDTDPPTPVINTYSGFSAVGIQLGFTFTIEDLPATNEHAHAYMT